MGEGKYHKAIKNEIIQSLKNNGYVVLKEIYVGNEPMAHGHMPRKRVDIFALKDKKRFCYRNLYIK